MSPRNILNLSEYDNPPEWMAERHPQLLSRAAEIAARLIDEEGYSEEQAYEIALERLQEETLERDQEDFDEP